MDMLTQFGQPLSQTSGLAAILAAASGPSENELMEANGILLGMDLAAARAGVDSRMLRTPRQQQQYRDQALAEIEIQEAKQEAQHRQMLRALEYSRELAAQERADAMLDTEKDTVIAESKAIRP